MPKIISIGNICIDRILGRTPMLPRWGTEAFFDHYEERLGGQGANFAIACARLGRETWLVGNVGSDPAGEKLLSELSGMENLHTEFVRKEKSITGFTISLIRTDGERLFLSSLGHQELFSLDSAVMPSIARGDLVHISGFFMLPKIRTQLYDFIKEIKSKGAITSFDPGWDPTGFGKNTRSIVYSVLLHFDYFEPDLIELSALTGEKNVARAVKKLGRKFSGVIALKEGMKGSRAFQQGKKLARAKSFSTKVVDTTGAGDSFDAGFLCSTLKGYDALLSLKWGNAAASITISNPEKMKSLPSFEKLAEYSHSM